MFNFKAKHVVAVTLFALMPGFSDFAGAGVFKWRDADGATHYSDTGHDGARQISIRPEQTFVEVEKVYDGDTVLLRDGRKVRLLGVNTPEIAHRDNAAEAGGELAKAWLENYLRGKKVRLQADAEKQDKYGRVLAYLFAEDGTHLNLELVKRGLAAVTVHPPNLLHAEALLAAQRQAELRKLGIWNEPAYAAKPAATLGRDNSRGWQRLTGRVAGVHGNRKYVYLDFSPQFSARIAQNDLPPFGEISAYAGKQVEVRGWVSRSHERYIMTLLHPSAIVLR